MSLDIKYGRKRNGIRRDLKAKIAEWIETIDDEVVRELASRNTIVTGGSIASMLLGESVNDYDVYFRTQETAFAVAQYYVNKFNEKTALEVARTGVHAPTPTVALEDIKNIKGVTESRVVIKIKSAGVAGETQKPYDYFEDRNADEAVEFAESAIKNYDDDKGEPYRVVFLSQNAITLSNKVQIVIRFFGEPTEIHDNYDFVHAMNYYDYGTDKLVLNAEALEALLSRVLIYKGSLYPIASIFRMKKFLERGWRITAGQQLKIMWQISEIDLNDFSVMREQLTGVDQAYMWQLIDALKSVDMDSVDSSYVGAIIDRIFD